MFSRRAPRRIPQNHHTIFFQAGGDGTGEHPKRHEIWSTRERNLLTFMGKSYLGSVDAQDYPET
ncbi:hypothetical protein MCOR07_000151 [Pyricularia oryzae]|nr:hypothetical protein MCOR29_008372 [Pyricularia oryzae]KAI6361714.1 hypothetical protein MCOR32_008630 [Pyricularia oryzae]KAI6545347.1 hypothetical protein MCOR03_011740 [Pyricularia oryzae]KAI6609190.1 hypothetical protein MCOR08_011459 [Pyricularia oryzae]KAI6630890.1 hypothetical protein MCOR07_000151 [Pyricularia oryzae]